jgi:hypothetical protein
LACKIKLADLKDNMNLDRLSTITKEDIDRLQKYMIAFSRLKSR